MVSFTASDRTMKIVLAFFGILAAASAGYLGGYGPGYIFEYGIGLGYGIGGYSLGYGLGHTGYGLGYKDFGYGYGLGLGYGGYGYGFGYAPVVRTTIAGPVFAAPVVKSVAIAPAIIPAITPFAKVAPVVPIKSAAIVAHYGIGASMYGHGYGVSPVHTYGLDLLHKKKA